MPWRIRSRAEACQAFPQMYLRHYLLSFKDISRWRGNIALCVTLGIFPEGPTFLCPPESVELWGITEEHGGDISWSRDPWTKSGIVIVRAGDQSSKAGRAKAHKLYKLLLDKVWNSAAKGVTIVLIAERPQAHKEAAVVAPLSFSVPERRGHEDRVKARLLMSIPAGRIPTDPGREWVEDAEGDVHASEHDGAGTGEAREVAKGWNAFPMQAWIYYKDGEFAPADLSHEQLGRLSRGSLPIYRSRWPPPDCPRNHVPGRRREGES